MLNAGKGRNPIRVFFRVIRAFCEKICTPHLTEATGYPEVNTGKARNLIRAFVRVIRAFCEKIFTSRRSEATGY